MAQRIVFAALARAFFEPKPLCMAPLRHAEEEQPIPACPGNLPRDGAQGSIPPRVELKAVFEHFHYDLAVVHAAREERAGRWQSQVSLNVRAVDRARGAGGKRRGQKVLWRARAEVGLVHDLGGSTACP